MARLVGALRVTLELRGLMKILFGMWNLEGHVPYKSKGIVGKYRLIEGGYRWDLDIVETSCNRTLCVP